MREKRKKCLYIIKHQEVQDKFKHDVFNKQEMNFGIQRRVFLKLGMTFIYEKKYCLSF